MSAETEFFRQNTMRTLDDLASRWLVPRDARDLAAGARTYLATLMPEAEIDKLRSCVVRRGGVGAAPEPTPCPVPPSNGKVSGVLGQFAYDPTSAMFVAQINDDSGEVITLFSLMMNDPDTAVSVDGDACAVAELLAYLGKRRCRVIVYLGEDGGLSKRAEFTSY